MHKLALLHLSDIHFKTGKNVIVDRVSDIAKVVASFSHEVDKVLLVISGDIAFSGLKQEYTIAEGFIADLLQALARSKVATAEDIVIVPGSSANSVCAKYAPVGIAVRVKLAH
jgi:hypothetical protein